MLLDTLPAVDSKTNCPDLEASLGKGCGDANARFVGQSLRLSHNIKLAVARYIVPWQEMLDWRYNLEQRALILMQAFTWNGFEDGTTWLGGLWAGRTTQQGDFATVVYRAQLYGFNAVRIPFR